MDPVENYITEAQKNMFDKAETPLKK